MAWRERDKRGIRAWIVRFFYSRDGLNQRLKFRCLVVRGVRKRNEYAVVAKGSRSGGAGTCGAGACIRACRFDATYLFAE